MTPILGRYSRDYRKILARARGQTKWLVHPDLTTVALGDSEASRRPEVRLPPSDPSCNGVQTYREAPACYLLRHFDDVGYAIVRSDWAIPRDEASMLFVQGGFFNHTHCHADDLSFEWFERGRKILSDGGRYAYTRDMWERYFESTRAHNTIEIDGLDYPTDQHHAYGDAVRAARKTSSGVRVVLQVDHDIPQLRVWHRRQIDYRPGEALTITDTLRGKRPHVYVQWHHFARAFALAGDAGQFVADDGELAVAVALSSSCGDDTKYLKIKGQRAPRLQGWASTRDRERHQRWALGAECRARTATFEARFELEAVVVANPTLARGSRRTDLTADDRAFLERNPDLATAIEALRGARPLISVGDDVAGAKGEAPAPAHRSEPEAIDTALD
jgi:hypothetical protein